MTPFVSNHPSLSSGRAIVKHVRSTADSPQQPRTQITTFVPEIIGPAVTGPATLGYGPVSASIGPSLSGPHARLSIFHTTESPRVGLHDRGNRSAGRMLLERHRRRPADTPRSQSVRIGQVIQPTSGAPSFSLLSVDQDSRCPRSVVCVRMGDVDVTLGYRVGGGATVPFTLRWGAPPSDTVIAGTRVSLDSVTPWPETPARALPPRVHRLAHAQGPSLSRTRVPQPTVIRTRASSAPAQPRSTRQP